MNDKKYHCTALPQNIVRLYNCGELKYPLLMFTCCVHNVYSLVPWIHPNPFIQWYAIEYSTNLQIPLHSVTRIPTSLLSL